MAPAPDPGDQALGRIRVPQRHPTQYSRRPMKPFSLIQRVWTWLRPVRSILRSWLNEACRPPTPHGVHPTVVATPEGVPVLVTSITTGTRPVPPMDPRDLPLRELLEAAGKIRSQQVAASAAGLVAELSGRGASEVIVLAESSRLGDPAILAAGPVSDKMPRSGPYPRPVGTRQGGGRQSGRSQTCDISSPLVPHP